MKRGRIGLEVGGCIVPYMGSRICFHSVRVTCGLASAKADEADTA